MSATPIETWSNIGFLLFNRINWLYGYYAHRCLSTGQPVIKCWTMTRPDLCLEFANTRYWRGQACRPRP